MDQLNVAGCYYVIDSWISPLSLSISMRSDAPVQLNPSSKDNYCTI